MEGVKLTICLIVAIFLQWTMRNVAEPLAYIDFPLIIVIYAALQRNSIRAILFGTISGIATDALSGGLLGANGFTKTLVAYIVSEIARRVYMDNLILRIPVLAGACLLNSFVFYGLHRLLGQTPTTHTLLDAPDLTRAVGDVVTAHPPDVVLAYCSGMARLVFQPPLDRLPCVLDMVDVDSAKWAVLAGRARPPKSWIYAREARLLSAFERAAAFLEKFRRVADFVGQNQARFLRHVVERVLDEARLFGQHRVDDRVEQRDHARAGRRDRLRADAHGVIDGGRVLALEVGDEVELAAEEVLVPSAEVHIGVGDVPSEHRLLHREVHGAGLHGAQGGGHLSHLVLRLHADRHDGCGLYGRSWRSRHR